MTWKEKMTTLISSIHIKPKLGMRVQALKKVDGRNMGDNEGEIVAILNTYEAHINWDTPTDFTYEEEGYENCWNAGVAEWKNGAFKILGGF